MTVYTDTRRDGIAEQAAEWFSRTREQRLEEDERQRFIEWLSESPVHVREFLGMAELWGGLHAQEVWPEQTVDEALEVVRSAARAQVLSLKEPVAEAKRSVATLMGRRSARRSKLVAVALAA